MKKMILVGRSECGKTTLKQALKGGTLQYHKTQYIYHTDVVIDTPGEYAQTRGLGRALALYSFETQVVALLLSSMEPYSLYRKYDRTGLHIVPLAESLLFQNVHRK